MALPAHPSLNNIVAIFVVALILRLAVFAGAIGFGHLTLARYTAKGDTTSYIAVAAAMTGERSFSSLEQYDRRVFPGYPALIAVVHLTGIPLPVAALITTWVSAGIAAAAAATAFADARVGWALTCLIPHYLINSSLGMSEAPLLACVCVALLLWNRDRLVLSGLCFGFAALVRPMACFAVAGVVFSLILNRRWRQAVVLAGASALTFVVGLVVMQIWTGDALQGVHVYANHPGAYAGHMMVYPFSALLTGTRAATPGRIVYIWIHVLVTLLAVWLAGLRLIRRPTDPRDAVSFPWLLCNTAMVLCVGPPWGFIHFPRFTIPAAPAMFWTLRPWLPRGRGAWVGIGLACLVFAIFGTIESP